MRVWDLRSMSQVREASVPAHVMDMELSADDRVLTVAAGKAVTFFEFGGSAAGAPSLATLKQHSMPDRTGFLEEGGASLHPSGRTYIAGGLDLWVRVFNFETGKEEECHKGHHGPIRCLRYSPGGDTFASGSEDGTIRIWQTDPSKASGADGGGGGGGGGESIFNAAAKAGAPATTTTTKS